MGGIKAQAEAGFTLVELLVVMVILGLLASIVGGEFFSKISSSKIRTAETQMKTIQQAVKIYKLDVGRVPTTEEGIAALLNKPVNLVTWNGPYLEGMPVGPWGRPYLYKAPAENGVEYSLSTLGRDGQPGGTGEDADIVMLGAKSTAPTQ